MPKLTLTDRYIASLQATGKQVDIWDAKQRGLILRVSADAEVKAWNVVYLRRADQKKRRHALGRYPDISLAEARDLALEALNVVAKGGDPVGERKRERQTVMSVSDLMDEYLKRKVAGHRSILEITRRLDRYARPVMGDTLVKDWHRRDVTLFLDKLAVKRKGALSGPAIANRVFDDLKALAGWAVEKGFIEADPLLHVSRPAELVRRERVLTAEEVKGVFDKLPTAEMEERMRKAIRLLFLTGCRASEIAELPIAEVDFEASVIRLPPERVKNGRAFVVPLVDEAVQIIREAIAEAKAAAIKRAARNKTEVEPVEFVFPSTRGTGPMEGHAISVAVRRNLETFETPERWTPHDIRRTVASGMAEVGVAPHIIEVALNHVSGFRAGVGGTYNRFAYEKEHRAALERWAGRLEEIRAGLPAKVRPLRRGAA